MFTPDEKVVKIMANFASINASMVIEPDKLSVINNQSSVVAHYTFPTPFTFNPFGFYDTPDALGIINAMSKPEIEVKEKFINIIGSNDDKVRYFTTASDLLPKVPDLEPKMSKVDWSLEFSLPADKLAILTKMAGILKSKFIFFETDEKRIRITLGNALESSGNNYELFITDGIKLNNLPDDTNVKIPMIDFKVLPGEYEVKISKRPSRWENLNGVVYYISSAA